MQILWCLHGNLQQSSAWNGLAQRIYAQQRQIEVINLWKMSAYDCRAWANAFYQHVDKIAAEHQNYLLGYSLGGRLALHGLIAKPDLWDKAIIISADPGVTTLKQKERCLKRDRIWAKRFLTEPWDELLREWDALPVFCGRPCTTPRPEANFDRHKIAHAFEAYSKGRMDNLLPRLSQLTIPITYVTGSDDRRYCQLGQTLMAYCPNLNHIIVKDAGHRVPWEQPEAFAAIVSQALAL